MTDELVYNPYAFAVHEDPYALYGRLRDEAPAYWNDELRFWALSRFADVVDALRSHGDFCSSQGLTWDTTPAEQAGVLPMLVTTDPPEHTKLRKLVNRGFTPRVIASLEDSVRQTARRVVAAVAPKGACDFVEEIAALLPLKIICDMMGIPEADDHRMFELSNVILGIGDPEYGVTMDVLMSAAVELSQYAQALGEERMAAPREDITSVLMSADVDGERLTPAEFASFFILLVVAGNETTRNSITGGLLAFRDFPAERAKAMANPALLRTGAAEIVRWVSPVHHMRRTTTRDVTLGGRALRAGDKVVLWYCSGNRDEAVFPEPFAFRIDRYEDPAAPRHLGFGTGQHVCLGQRLADLQIKVAFEELFARLPGLHPVADGTRVRSNFINGWKTLPVQLA